MSKTGSYVPENYDAFISYRHDTGFYMAQVIYDKLVQNGYSVFMDKRLERGEFEPQIKEAVEKSRNFILVIFPGDLDGTDDENDWIRKETEWADATPNMNFIPVFCDGFKEKSAKIQLPACVARVLRSKGIVIHKDNSLDSKLDELCDIALKNANPVKPLINTIEFFHNNLHEKDHLTVKGIDMAFHGGAAWLRAGTQKEILDEIIKRKIPTRILVNTPEAAESIAKHMRDEYALYFPFEQVNKLWSKYASDHPDVLQIKACPVPFLRVYHNIKFKEDKVRHTHDRMHIKYYVYQNMNLENSFEHELSSFSKYYEIYQKEFEFLWESATSL
ncbi:MAG: toll/interleukin-1 receptor domain-containing protein [Clostridia bacterium]|nr:toll/interleukin-1 receptor domain-containing protein [Clostridia bacterium]